MVTGDFKGLIHVHSNFSYDGVHSLSELEEFGRKKGYHFIALTEHSETLNDETMLRYVAECENVSRAGCLIVPGIEFDCENDIHILGLGAERYTSRKDAVEVAQFIKEQNGIAVIAHPKRRNHSVPSALLEVADGIEVWNVAYDGRFVPNTQALRLLEKARDESNGRRRLAFGGQDLHRLTAQSKVETTVAGDHLDKKALLEALGMGDFIVSNQYFKLKATERIRFARYAFICSAREVYSVAKAIKNNFS